MWHFLHTKTTFDFSLLSVFPSKWCRSALAFPHTEHGCAGNFRNARVRPAFTHASSPFHPAWFWPKRFPFSIASGERLNPFGGPGRNIGTATPASLARWRCIPVILRASFSDSVFMDTIYHEAHTGATRIFAVVDRHRVILVVGSHAVTEAECPAPVPRLCRCFVMSSPGGVASPRAVRGARYCVDESLITLATYPTLRSTVKGEICMAALTDP